MFKNVYILDTEMQMVSTFNYSQLILSYIKWKKEMFGDKIKINILTYRARFSHLK